MTEGIRNKVAESGIITIDLESFIPDGELVLFDLKPLLFHELILREKDLREFIKSHDWSHYKDKFIAVTCLNDAIVPTWAFMLIAIALEPYAKRVIHGNLSDLEEELILEAINSLDLSPFSGARVVIKGCGDKKISVNAFVQLTSRLRPVAKSIMYGEPCSTVPLYKRSG